VGRPLEYIKTDLENLYFELFLLTSG